MIAPTLALTHAVAHRSEAFRSFLTTTRRSLLSSNFLKYLAIHRVAHS